MTKLRLAQSCRKHATGLLAAAALLLGISSANAQQVFKTPEEAATALAAAVKSGATRDVLKVLGRDGVDIMFSGDEVADREARERFVGAYDAKHNVTVEGDKAFLVVGADDFPLPIPLIRQEANWKFDTAAGRLEVLYRRIGRNELDAIQTSLAYVDAQNEYAEKDRTGAGPGVYAQRIVSSSGKKDGLYWPASDGDASPLGELVAQASAEGYKAGGGTHAVPRLLLSHSDAARAERSRRQCSITSSRAR